MPIKVIYHLLNGEIKEVIYKNKKKYSKMEFMNQMCRCNNGNYGYFSDEDIKSIVNLNYVCFFDIEEVNKDEIK